jgi:hypothetical protein
MKLIAFWKYDEFPGFKYAAIEEFSDNGMVSVKGYGRFFRPFLIVPDCERTSAAINAVEDITRDYKKRRKETLEALHADAMKRVNTVFDDIRKTELIDGTKDPDLSPFAKEVASGLMNAIAYVREKSRREEKPWTEL